jgi:hypothetical protein
MFDHATPKQILEFGGLFFLSKKLERSRLT